MRSQLALAIALSSVLMVLAPFTGDPQANLQSWFTANPLNDSGSSTDQCVICKEFSEGLVMRMVTCARSEGIPSEYLSAERMP
jgi:hypothetical protein